MPSRDPLMGGTCTNILNHFEIFNSRLFNIPKLNKIIKRLLLLDLFFQYVYIAGFQCHAIQNKNQNHSIDKVQILRKERR